MVELRLLNEDDKGGLRRMVEMGAMVVKTVLVVLMIGSIFKQSVCRFREVLVYITQEESLVAMGRLLAKRLGFEKPF